MDKQEINLKKASISVKKETKSIWEYGQTLYITQDNREVSLTLQYGTVYKIRYQKVNDYGEIDFSFEHVLQYYINRADITK